VTRSWVTHVVGLLALMAIFGVFAVQGSPDGGTAIGIWPVGLATACLLVSRRPRTPVMLAVIGIVAVLAIWAGGRDLDVAVGLGIGIALETWVMWRVFTQGRRERVPLRVSGDLARFVVAAASAAVVVGIAAFLTSVVTGWGSPPRLALALLTSSLASQLVVVPFFTRLRLHASAAGPAERAFQWLCILTLTPLVFYPADFPSVVFMVLPLLTWCALRTAPVEALLQTLVVLGFAIVLTTYGHGPFANAGPRFGFSADSQGILLATFIVVCALVVVPLILAVGEQLESAREAAAERDKVQNIVNGADGVAIIGTDELGLVTLFNPGAERVLGYEAHEILGKGTRMLHSDQGIATAARELGVENDFSVVAQAIMGLGATDMGFVRKDGVERMHSMSLNRVVDDRGQVTGYVSTSEDITERVEAERALMEALETERQAVERLRDVDQVKDAFVSSVSHELRTPITSILGYTEMLEDGVYGDLSVEQLDAVHRVAGNSSRLLSLIDDLLTLSRVQEDGIRFVDRVVDLRKIVAAGCAVVAPTMQRRDLELTVDLPDEPIPFLGDRDMLERVVINLVGNAVKFTPEGGEVTVGLHTELETVVLTVADSGIGIPPQEQERLFSRFFRSSLAQEQAIPGSGLGLSIAHAIVEKHGGTMAVESEPGVGTTFRVRLPLIAPA
jgi:PAS domain S-box-containing protein